MRQADRVETASDNRLRREERIRKQADLKAVFDTHQSTGNRRLVVHWRTNDLGHARLGIRVSRRYGNSVARNLFKRRIREIFRSHKHKLGELDLVVLPSRHQGAKDARRGYSDFGQLKESFLKLLAKIDETSQTHNGSTHAGS